MNKSLFTAILFSLGTSIYAAEPLCLAPIEASGVSPETQNSVPTLFKYYIDNQGKYQISSDNSACSKTVVLNVTKLGQATVVNAKLQGSDNKTIWTTQQKVLKEENIDKALSKVAELMNENSQGDSTAAATESSSTVYQSESAATPTATSAETAVQKEEQPKTPRTPNVYFGIGLGLTKFIGDEINEFTDFEPLTMYDFFFAYDSKFMITMLNLSINYKVNTITRERPQNESYYYNSSIDIETTYITWGFAFYYPILSGPITPYIGLGMSATNFDIEYDYEDDVSDNGLQAHIGGGILLNRHSRLNTWIHAEYFFNTYEPINHTFHGFSLLMRVSLGV